MCPRRRPQRHTALLSAFFPVLVGSQILSFCFSAFFFFPRSKMQNEKEEKRRERETVSPQQRSGPKMEWDGSSCCNFFSMLVSQRNQYEVAYKSFFLLRSKMYFSYLQAHTLFLWCVCVWPVGHRLDSGDWQQQQQQPRKPASHSAQCSALQHSTDETKNSWGKTKSGTAQIRGQNVKEVKCTIA